MDWINLYIKLLYIFNCVMRFGKRAVIIACCFMLRLCGVKQIIAGYTKNGQWHDVSNAVQRYYATADKKTVEELHAAISANGLLMAWEDMSINIDLGDGKYSNGETWEDIPFGDISLDALSDLFKQKED